MSISIAMSFLRDESGSTAIEYALIGSLVALGIIAGLTQIGVDLDAFFTDIASNF